MKKRLAVLFAIAACLLAVVPAKSVRAADPGSRYADAFVLIEQGQAAEEKSDLATAYHKYQASLDILHTIRSDSPDWNAQMVEYRLKDCQSRFDAVKAKLPSPPPAAAGDASVITPTVQVPTPPPVPVVIAPAPVPAPVPVVKAASDQSAKFKAQIEKLETENHQLKSDLSEAKRAAKSVSEVDTLTKENKDLKTQLADARKKAAVVKPVPAPVPVDSGEAKKLRTELADAHAEIDRLKKASATGSPEVIASQPVVAPQADSVEMKKLRAELSKTQADADKARKSATDLEKKNSDLSAQLANTKKEAAAKPVAPVESPELKKTRADLDAARADAAAQAKKDASQLSDLQKQNKDLNTKLASAEKKSNVASGDSSEVKSLRSELDKSNAQVADLKKQLAAKPAAAPSPAVDSGEVKSLHTQLANTQKELDEAKKSAGRVPELEKQNQDLSAKLAASDKKASSQAADLEKQNKDLSAKLAAEKKAEAEAPTVAPDARVMKELRNENSYFRNLLDTYAEQNPELKGQLRRHDQNQSKSSQ